MADDVLYAGVRGVTDLMVMPGLINLDFADIRTVMMEMGKAMMGTGEAEGEKRALEAAEAAIANPLLDDVSMKGAKGVLINITGGADMTLFEVDEAANRIREEIDSDANIIFGSTFDESLEGRMRLSLVATGIGAEAAMPRLHSFAQTNAVGTLHAVPAAEEAPAHAAAAEPVAQQASEAPPVQPPLRLAAERASPPPAVRSADPLTGGATMHAPAGGGTVAAAAAVAVEAPAEAPMAEARPAPTAPAPASAEKPFIPPRPMAPTGRAARPRDGRSLRRGGGGQWRPTGAGEAQPVRAHDRHGPRPQGAGGGAGTDSGEGATQRHRRDVVVVRGTARGETGGACGGPSRACACSGRQTNGGGGGFAGNPSFPAPSGQLNAGRQYPISRLEEP